MTHGDGVLGGRRILVGAGAGGAVDALVLRPLPLVRLHKLRVPACGTLACCRLCILHFTTIAAAALLDLPIHPPRVFTTLVEQQKVIL